MNKEFSNKTLKIIIVSVLLLILISGLIIIILLNGPRLDSNPEINIKIYGSSEVKLDEPSDYTIVVTNNGSIDLFDVVVNDTYGFIWSGNLNQSESKTFNLVYNGQYEEGDIIEVFVNGHSKGGEHVTDNDLWTFNVVGESYDIIEALNRGCISAEFRGTGYCSGEVIELKITPQIDVEIEISIEASLILINPGVGQNMILAETMRLDIKPEIEIEIEIEAYCLDYEKDNPSSSETFNLQANAGSYNEDVITLIRSLEDVPGWNKSVTVVQIGVWVITDDISEEEIPFDYSEDDIDDTEWLLENAGINTSDKTLFQE